MKFVIKYLEEKRSIKKKMEFLIVFLIVFGIVILSIALGCYFSKPSTSAIDSIGISSQKTPTTERFEILKKPHLSKTGNFQDVIYYCPPAPPKTFQQMIAINKSTKEIISASNSFLTDELFINSFNQEYEKRYGIYGGLLKSYEKIQERPIDQEIKERTVMISNSFTGTNSGHDLGTMLATLLYIRKHKLENCELGIQELGFKFPRILEILELFYSEGWKIFQADICYHFDSIDFVIVSPIFIIEEYKKPNVIALIDEIKTKSQFYLLSQGCNPPKNAKIVLLKQIHNTSARTHDAFHGASFFAKMNEDGWIILNPEFDDMRYMICLLSYASTILISYGAIMWTHMLFFNQDATIIHLQVQDEQAYDPVFNMKHFNRILMKDTYLDSDQNKDIIEKINSF